MPDNLNADSLQSLQQDAIRRAREMQARARIPSYSAPQQRAQSAAQGAPMAQNVPQGGIPQNIPAQEIPPPPPQENRNPLAADPSPAADPPPTANSPGAGSPPHGAGGLDSLLSGGALDFLMKDSDRTMILLLMLILLEEKADYTLIFGLMYLLL